MKNEILYASGGFKRIIVARFSIGSDVLECLEELVKKEKIRAGAIITGIATLSKMRVRSLDSIPKDFPRVQPGLNIFEVEGALEVLNMSGIIFVRDRDVFVHPHITACDANGKMYGGHLMPGSIVYMTCEVIIGEFEGLTMGSKLDARVGHPLLTPRTTRRTPTSRR